MEQVPQEQQTPSEPKKNSLLEELEFGVGGVMLGIGTFLLMLFVLNYFHLSSACRNRNPHSTFMIK